MLIFTYTYYGGVSLATPIVYNLLKFINFYVVLKEPHPPDLATLACVNADCQHFGRTGQGNLAIRKVYGKDGLRLLRCGRCHEEFSERRNTALFNTKVSEAKAETIIDHLDEGCSVRATSRLTKAAKVTVARLLKTSGRHAQRFQHQEVHDLKPRAIQFDEQWSFVKKKQKNCDPEEIPQAGDFWDHTAIAPDSKLVVSLVVGKRTQEQTQTLVSDTQSRLRKGHLPALFSDGYEGYEPTRVYDPLNECLFTLSISGDERKIHHGFLSLIPRHPIRNGALSIRCKS